MDTNMDTPISTGMDGISNGKRWYVVRTQAHGETKAKHHLERQGYPVYLPRYTKRRRHARRIEWLPSPLFPRYLFVSLDPETDQWRPIRSTIGVSHLVCNGDRPTPLPDGIIEDIRCRENEHGMVTTEPRVPFKKNEKVQIINGPLADQVGLFDCATDDERVFILLDLLGRRVRVRMPAEAIHAYG